MKKQLYRVRINVYAPKEDTQLGIKSNFNLQEFGDPGKTGSDVADVLESALISELNEVSSDLQIKEIKPDYIRLDVDFDLSDPKVQSKYPGEMEVVKNQINDVVKTILNEKFIGSIKRTAKREDVPEVPLFIIKDELKASVNTYGNTLGLQNVGGYRFSVYLYSEKNESTPTPTEVASAEADSINTKSQAASPSKVLKEQEGKSQPSGENGANVKSEQFKLEEPTKEKAVGKEDTPAAPPVINNVTNVTNVNTVNNQVTAGSNIETISSSTDTRLEKLTPIIVTTEMAKTLEVAAIAKILGDNAALEKAKDEEWTKEKYEEYTRKPAEERDPFLLKQAADLKERAQVSISEKLTVESATTNKAEATASRYRFEGSKLFDKETGFYRIGLAIKDFSERPPIVISSSLSSEKNLEKAYSNAVEEVKEILADMADGDATTKSLLEQIDTKQIIVPSLAELALSPISDPFEEKPATQNSEPKPGEIMEKSAAPKQPIEDLSKALRDAAIDQAIKNGDISPEDGVTLKSQKPDQFWIDEATKSGGVPDQKSATEKSTTFNEIIKSEITKSDLSTTTQAGAASQPGTTGETEKAGLGKTSTENQAVLPGQITKASASEPTQVKIDGSSPASVVNTQATGPTSIVNSQVTKGEIKRNTAESKESTKFEEQKTVVDKLSTLIENLYVPEITAKGTVQAAASLSGTAGKASAAGSAGETAIVSEALPSDTDIRGLIKEAYGDFTTDSTKSNAEEPVKVTQATFSTPPNITAGPTPAQISTAEPASAQSTITTGPTPAQISTAEPASAQSTITGGRSNTQTASGISPSTVSTATIAAPPAAEKPTSSMPTPSGVATALPGSQEAKAIEIRNKSIDEMVSKKEITPETGVILKSQKPDEFWMKEASAESMISTPAKTAGSAAGLEKSANIDSQITELTNPADQANSNVSTPAKTAEKTSVEAVFSTSASGQEIMSEASIRLPKNSSSNLPTGPGKIANASEERVGNSTESSLVNNITVNSASAPSLNSVNSETNNSSTALNAAEITSSLLNLTGQTEKLVNSETNNSSTELNMLSPGSSLEKPAGRTELNMMSSTSSLANQASQIDRADTSETNNSSTGLNTAVLTSELSNQASQIDRATISETNNSSTEFNMLSPGSSLASPANQIDRATISETNNSSTSLNSATLTSALLNQAGQTEKLANSETNNSSTEFNMLSPGSSLASPANQIDRATISETNNSSTELNRLSLTSQLENQASQANQFANFVNPNSLVPGLPDQIGEISGQTLLSTINSTNSEKDRSSVKLNTLSSTTPFNNPINRNSIDSNNSIASLSSLMGAESGPSILASEKPQIKTNQTGIDTVSVTEPVGLAANIRVEANQPINKPELIKAIVNPPNPVVESVANLGQTMKNSSNMMATTISDTVKSSMANISPSSNTNSSSNQYINNNASQFTPAQEINESVQVEPAKAKEESSVSAGLSEYYLHEIWSTLSQGLKIRNF